MLLSRTMTMIVGTRSEQDKMMRFDPFRELDRLTQPMWMASVPLDVYRKGEKFVVRVDLPGIDPTSLDLTIERNVLSIKAERSWVPVDGDEVLVAERPQGTFDTPPLPERGPGCGPHLCPVRARCADSDGARRCLGKEPARSPSASAPPTTRTFSTSRRASSRHTPERFGRRGVVARPCPYGPAPVAEVESPLVLDVQASQQPTHA